MHATLRHALVSLAVQEARKSREYGQVDLRIREHVQYVCQLRPIDESTLEALLTSAPSVGQVTARGTWIFLPAPDRGSLRIPVLNVIYDSASIPPIANFHLGIFYNADPEPLAMGWRFECPEMPGHDDTESTHAYYHAQSGHAVRTIASDRRLPVANTATEIPSGHPTFPMDAGDEVDLFVCMLLSLYGLRQADALIQAMTQPDLHSRLRKMRCRGRAPLED